MKDGDENYRLSFDDETGIVYFAREETTRALHISACAWIELSNGRELPPPQLKK